MSWDLFSKHYQICKRCTLAKKKKHEEDMQVAGGAGTACVQTLPAPLPVVVRKMPIEYEGDRIRSCNHFQWIWCPSVPGNPKCQVRHTRHA